MRMVFLGGGEFGTVSLEWLADSGHEVALVVTQPARPSGRGQKVVATSIADLAQRRHLTCMETADVNTPENIQRILSLRPQVLLVIAFGQKIGTELLHVPDAKTINLHSSLLPKFRGAAPINWAIINGETETGLTVIELNDQWDAGAILGRLKTPIRPDETAGELHDRLAAMGPQLLEDVLNKIASGTIEPLPQDHSQACRAPKLKKTDGALDWSRPALTLRNQIHGLWPWPGAYCQVQPTGKDRPERLMVARTQSLEKTCSAEPGTLSNDLTIACGQGQLRLLEVKPDNGRLMRFTDFVNGRRLQPGDRFLPGNQL